MRSYVSDRSKIIFVEVPQEGTTLKKRSILDFFSYPKIGKDNFDKIQNMNYSEMIVHVGLTILEPHGI